MQLSLGDARGAPGGVVDVGLVVGISIANVAAEDSTAEGA